MTVDASAVPEQAPAPVLMRLRVILPGDVLVDESVARIVAEAHNGSFGLLPRHADFTTALVPGIVVYATADGRERFLGVDEGVLVKIADDVLISTRGAVEGDDLVVLRERVAQRFRMLGEREKAARSALARLEASLARRFIELQEQP